MSADLESARAVLDARRDEILRRYAAVGVGLGADPDQEGGYAIVVYLGSTHDRPDEPEAVDGVPVRFEVTGPFRAQ